MKIRYMFLRDSTNAPIGCLAIKLLRQEQQLQYQVSILNPADRKHPLTRKSLPFNRAVARQLAAGRLFENPFYVSMPTDATMNQITVLVMQDLASLSAPSKRGDVPARAIKAAKTWLATNSR